MRRKTNTPGFTMLELIVSLLLSALVLLGLTSVFSGTLRVWTRIEQSSDALNNGRILLNWLSRDISEKSITGTGSGNTVIAFEDGTSYTYSGTTVMRDSNIISNKVKQLQLYFHDPEDIKYVTISASIEKKPKNVLFTTSIAQRNTSKQNE